MSFCVADECSYVVWAEKGICEYFWGGETGACILDLVLIWGVVDRLEFVDCLGAGGDLVEVGVY